MLPDQWHVLTEKIMQTNQGPSNERSWAFLHVFFAVLSQTEIARVPVVTFLTFRNL